MSISKSLRDLSRLKKITTVLFKLELGFLVERLNLKNYLTFHKKLQKEKFQPRIASPKKIRQALEELSGTFIKLGQLLSLRPDLIPKEYSEEFANLQDNVKPFHYTIAKHIIEKELNKPFREIFETFDKKPLASASIGQVHKAKLVSGEVVAVKVQRPKIKGAFEADIDILYHLAHLVERHMPELQHYNPTEIVKEFERYTTNELDYIKEAKNIDFFYNNFKDDKRIKVPKVFWDYTTKKVLTMEFIEGTRITGVKDFKKFKSSKKETLKNIVNVFLTQIIEHGFFHADPHPGNIFLQEKNQIALLDFGIVGMLDKELSMGIENMLIAFVEGDRNLLADTFIEIGLASENTNIAEFREDLAYHLGSYRDLPLKEIQTSTLLYDLLSIGRKYQFKFPSNFVLLVKAVATIEGLGRKLDPDFNFIDFARPIVDKIKEERTSPNYVLDTLKKNLFMLKTGMLNLPEELIKTLKSLQQGKVKVDLEDSDIKRFSAEVDRSSNRITYGIVIASLIIASALIMLAKLPPFLFGLPWLGIVFLIIAIIVTFFLIISISKEERGGENGIT